MSKFTPSKYQKDIFNFIKNGTENAIISAVAGSGKTTTLVKALEQIPSDKTVLFLAFNKSIADELKVRVPQTSNITVKTVHGFGYTVLRNQFEVEIDNKKYGKMLKDIISFHTNKTKSSIEKYKFDKTHLAYISKMSSAVKTDEGDNKDFFGDVINLTNLGRLHLIDTEIKLNGIEKLNELAKIHSVGNEDGESEVAWYLIKLGSSYVNEIDYTDMVYLPNVLHVLQTEVYDFVFIDECQDLNTCQRHLMEKAIKPETGRFIAVGDPKQAIYGFAGADYESFKKLCDIPNTIQLPLSVTYRCGTSIIDMIKHINPFIKTVTKARAGEVLHNFSYKDIQDGDMVLCRQTFPVVSLCIKLLSEGKRAYIVGSDIGLSLIKMIGDCQRVSEEFNMTNVFSRLYNEKSKIIDKLMKNHGISKSEALEDSFVIMYNEKIQVIEALSKDITDPNEVIAKIHGIFSDTKKVGICLSTIHKSKGLESDRVFILQRELMPSKYATLPWQMEQEDNLMYVAYTRAKNTLGFISDYDAWKTHKSESENVVAVMESKHIGAVGMKMNLKLKVLNIKKIDGQYGETLIYEMKDDKNNIFSKFGEINPRFLSDSNEKEVKVGSSLNFYGIISGHSEFRGTKNTKIGRISQH